ncbi:polyhydroxyalkanoate synthesis repressor PhaR [Iodidimonas gelatinilytica]|uniref:Polyhydroxyalkanoate synthesis repressor PhaR n=1 Tax=Iodidimonas gelatinilytica TaxID=1236966 RepID=A0A5A7MMM6_9PROT|nr:polyhydroxyalkanoate synthesis repressor PhaR [Iodidimonas gelatinilytica]GEQ97252.1 polyhydroxyalkanoate synthesis repressor PhaR [Iodidimonas gelatinilytica]GEQ99580.1 polyhydroxyalkanoate synthesis repressor PhaR [Iodidimonas gelatinilytica]
MAQKKQDADCVIIKKYANRRLYNTETSSYVTLDHLAQLVRDGRDFVVRDAKSGDDITRAVLAQIIFEQESRGQEMLPIPFLRQLIGFYGDRLQSMVPGYLQTSMDAFSQNQEHMRAAFENSLNPAQAMSMLDEAARKNMQVFEQTFKMFNPFADKTPATSPHDTKADSRSDQAPTASEGKIDALEKQLAAMQSQLDEMRKK